MTILCENTLEIEGTFEALDKFLLDFRGYEAFVEITQEVFDNHLNVLNVLEGETYHEWLEGVRRKRFGEKPYPCLNALYPIPQELCEVGDVDGIIKWCEENWGTKRDIVFDDFEVGEGMDYVRYHFESANTPPSAWLVHVAPLYPQLRFTLSFNEDTTFCGIDGCLA